MEQTGGGPVYSGYCAETLLNREMSVTQWVATNNGWGDMQNSIVYYRHGNHDILPEDDHPLRGITAGPMVHYRHADHDTLPSDHPPSTRATEYQAWGGGTSAGVGAISVPQDPDWRSPETVVGPEYKFCEPESYPCEHIAKIPTTDQPDRDLTCSEVSKELSVVGNTGHLHYKWKQRAGSDRTGAEGEWRAQRTHESPDEWQSERSCIHVLPDGDGSGDTLGYRWISIPSGTPGTKDYHPKTYVAVVQDDSAGGP